MMKDYPKAFRKFVADRTNRIPVVRTPKCNGLVELAASREISKLTIKNNMNHFKPNKKKPTLTTRISQSNDVTPTGWQNRRLAVGKYESI
jgi:hypothetical protein